MSDGIKAEPFFIGGILVWKITSLRDNHVVAEGPTINDAVRNIPEEEYIRQEENLNERS